MGIIYQFLEFLNPLIINFYRKGGFLLEITGIICEYNPLHAGHEKQIAQIRQRFGEDNGIVCLMSGNFVQRGMPAILDKSIRAEAAIGSGADLVLELPVTAALSSAEGFATEGVRILSYICNRLSFGAESPEADSLLATAQTLLSDAFPPVLRKCLDEGLSFPAARQKALEELGLSGELLTSPNNILAVEYCKAILAQKSTMLPCPIYRPGSYHAENPDQNDPSATSLRGMLYRGEDIASYVPSEAAPLFREGALHSLSFGERAVLGKLRTMSEAEFSLLPGGSEGLWRKLMHAVRECTTLEEIAAYVKSKRYTRTRIDRMILCAFLGITEELLATPAPYVRVLAFNDRGREILKSARKQFDFVNAGEVREGEYAQLEARCGDLYGLFAEKGPEAPGAETRRRVRYIP